MSALGVVWLWKSFFVIKMLSKCEFCMLLVTSLLHSCAVVHFALFGVWVFNKTRGFQ